MKIPKFSFQPTIIVSTFSCLGYFVIATALVVFKKINETFVVCYFTESYWHFQQLFSVILFS